MASPGPDCRILIDASPHGGAWNMAVDETLLESALAGRICTIRFYRWSEATLSLGYFQEAAAAAQSPELAKLPVVRRLSGGGAILHHEELTYSCAIVPSHGLAESPSLLYDRVHSAVIAVLAEFGVAARMRGTPLGLAEEPFLCFGRGDPRDVVLQGHKVLGSAQRRRRGAVLQHGSLLLKQSPYAPQFPGLADLVPTWTEPPDLAERLAQTVGMMFDGATICEPLTHQEQARTRELFEQRYCRLDWGKRR